LEVMTQIYGLGTSSWHQRMNRVVAETFIAADTSAALTARLGIRLIETLARTFESKPAYTVYNKAGYRKVYNTQAEALADAGNITDTWLVWVIADQKAYTFANAGSTFADHFTEKTSWTGELAGGSAETVLACKYLDVVQKQDTSHRLYIICKDLAQDDQRKFGYESPVYVGAQWLDKSSSDAKTDIGVTRVQEQQNPGDGKSLRNWEVALDKIHRPYGRFERMGENPVLAIDTTASYTVLTLGYRATDGTTPHQLGYSENNVHTLFIPFTSSADAANFLAAIAVTYTAATPASLAALTLGDLANVVTTGATDGEQLTYVDSTATWEPGASGV
jgi:hypothetical protein